MRLMTRNLMAPAVTVLTARLANVVVSQGKWQPRDEVQRAGRHITYASGSAADVLALTPVGE